MIINFLPGVKIPVSRMERVSHFSLIIISIDSFTAYGKTLQNTEVGCV